MRIRNVNTQLYNRVINWIEYQWIWGRRLNEDEKVSKLLYVFGIGMSTDIGRDWKKIFTNPNNDF